MDKFQSKKEVRKYRKKIRNFKKNLGDIFILNTDIFIEIFKRLDNTDLYFFLLSSKIISDIYKNFINIKLSIDPSIIFSSVPRMKWFYHV